MRFSRIDTGFWMSNRFSKQELQLFYLLPSLIVLQFISFISLLFSDPQLLMGSFFITENIIHCLEFLDL